MSPASFIGITEAARSLGLSPSMVRKMIAKGVLRYRTTPYGKLVRVADVNAEKARREEAKRG